MRSNSERRETLERKQYLVSPSQIAKIKGLAKDSGASETEIVRRAIDAYDPDMVEGMDNDDLLQLVSERLKEAIESTKKANRVVRRTIKSLDRVGG